jgi:protein ImuB
VGPHNSHFHIGIAANPDAAICAARGWPGVTILEQGSEAVRLKALDISLLPLEPEQQATLLRWGIRTFGALAKLPAKDLAVRLGQSSVHLHRLARGCAKRPLVPRKESLVFVETFELDDALTTLEPLGFILNRMCEVLLLRLRSRGLAALELHLTLKRERSHEPFVLPLRLPVPARTPRTISRLFMLALEARPPGAGITEVKLEAMPSKPRVIQSGLFVPLSPEPEKLELTLARIAAVVGKGNVGSPALADTYARNHFTMQRFGTDFGVIDRRRHGALRLFRPPFEATVRLKENIPSWIGFSGMHGNVTAASGPWRSSGQWWDIAGKVWSREEWDVAVSGSLLRIFRVLPEQRWYAEGVYD